MQAAPGETLAPDSSLTAPTDTDEKLKGSAPLDRGVARRDPDSEVAPIDQGAGTSIAALWAVAWLGG